MFTLLIPPVWLSVVWGLQRSCAERKWRWRYQPPNSVPTSEHGVASLVGMWWIHIYKGMDEIDAETEIDA